MNEQEYGRPYHPAANIFPLMVGDDFDVLKRDIAANGLREAIWLTEDGQILDGRNRHRACIDLDIAPRFQTYSGDEPVAFVVSLNVARRHLTSSQLAALSTDVLPMLEAEARERMSVASANKGVEIFPPLEQGKSRDTAASLFSTNARYVSDAKRIKGDAPDLFEQVKTGELTIPQAKREIVQRERQDAPPLPSDKYRILYADPPWSYGNSGIIGETDHYGHVGRHYPSMTISELCAMGDQIKAIVESDAVMFMWVTSPLLEECFPVIRAWGFKYKTSFVWDKVKHNFGHYNSVRHEMLLVCTRGSCTPDNSKLYDSVQTIERSDTHSEKPAEFRDIIDDLYPTGKRLELFARQSVNGWSGWGNE